MLNYNEMTNEELTSFIDSLSEEDNLSSGELNSILAEVTNRNIDKGYINKITELIYLSILNADKRTIKDRRKEAKEAEKLKRKLEREMPEYEVVEDVEEVSGEQLAEAPQKESDCDDATKVLPIVEDVKAPAKKDRIDEYFESLDNPQDDDDEEYDKKSKNDDEPYPILNFISGMCAVLAWIAFVIAVVMSCFVGFKYFGQNPLLIMVSVIGGFVAGTFAMLIFYYFSEKIQLMLSIEDYLYKLSNKKGM